MIMKKISGESDKNPRDYIANPSVMKVLVIDDEQSFTEEMCEFLKKSGYFCMEAWSGPEGMKILKNQKIDLLILDVMLPGMNGLEVLKLVKSTYPQLEVIVISGHGNMDTVISAMRLGALDYLRKPLRHSDVQIAIERSAKFIRLNQRLKQIEEKYSLISKTLEAKIERKFIGISPQIREVFDQAIMAAGHPDANVLITGESGTGKENIARVIHYSSARKDHIFYAINSSAITDTLMESEFFGHKKGSFTGAVSDRMGYFEVCNQGTLFLDEISDMPLNLQAKLLRVTEDKMITRIGDTNRIYTDFRLISATNHNIEKLVEKKKFRLDLLHRLNTLHIHIPPLRERPEDIRPLLEHFAGEYAHKYNRHGFTIANEVFEALSRYDFPGNVRELKNMTERAFILNRSDKFSIQDFPVKPTVQNKEAVKNKDLNLQAVETGLVKDALKSTGNNQKAAAEILGITRDALIRKMKKYNIKIIKTQD